MRHDDHQQNVNSDPDALRREREHDENHADDRDVDVKVGREPLADAAEDRAIANQIQPPRRRGVGMRTFARGGGTGHRWFSMSAVHGTHLLNDPLHLGVAHDGLVLTEDAIALVGDGLLEIGNNLRLVRVVLQLDFGGIEVRAQRRERALFQLIRVAIQVDDDDFLHSYGPSCVIVALMASQ